VGGIDHTKLTFAEDIIIDFVQASLGQRQSNLFLVGGTSCSVRRHVALKLLLV
jgi:hypothetical protein